MAEVTKSKGKTMRLFFMGLFLVAGAVSLTALPDPPGIPDSAASAEIPFRIGERFEFRAMYNSFVTGNVNAGEAVLEVREQAGNAGNQSVIQFVGAVNTTGLFNRFYRVENRYESHYDHEARKPLRFSEQVREGSYRRNYDVSFDYETMQARSVREATETTRETTEIPVQVQDMLSAFYYARSFDMDTLQPGDAIGIDLFMHDTVYVSRILYEGREQITTSMGTFNTLKFRPEVLEGPVFSQPYPMTIWISDDKNRMPVRIESGLVVGRARLDLTGFRRLRYPVESFVTGSRRR